VKKREERSRDKRKSEAETRRAKKRQEERRIDKKSEEVTRAKQRQEERQRQEETRRAKLALERLQGQVGRHYVFEKPEIKK
jgi:hypothetical protein